MLYCHLAIATFGNDRWRHDLLQLRLDVVYLDSYLFYVYVYDTKTRQTVLLCGVSAPSRAVAPPLRNQSPNRAPVSRQEPTVTLTYVNRYHAGCND